jgi:hypothetical protein
MDEDHVDKSALPGQYKAWCYQHGVLTRLKSIQKLRSHMQDQKEGCSRGWQEGRRSLFLDMEKERKELDKLTVSCYLGLI